jgi:hypothetical protein
MDRSLVLGLVAVALALGAPHSEGGGDKPHEKGPRLGLELELLGRYQAPGEVFDQSAAEIVAHDPRTRRLFVVNGATNRIDVLDFADPANITLLFSIDLGAFGAGPTSVAVRDGIVAVAVEGFVKQQPGKAVFFDTDGNLLNHVSVGALPDMVTFTPDGKTVLTANEGEPSADYADDPPGSVSVIRVRRGVRALEQKDVCTAGFERFNAGKLDSSIRIFGPNASVAQDLEPEYIAVSEDSRTAWVTLQENNAIGILDIRGCEFEKLEGLGFKNHLRPGSGLDASDRDGRIQIANWPIRGMYLPDSIGRFSSRGKSFLVTANEGDARDYDAFAEEARIGSLDLDPTAFPDHAALKNNAALGRLNVTLTRGDTDGDGDYDALYSFGGRSFSIWDSRGELVYDSGDALERITADAFPEFFNSDNAENNFDNRSDNKGPEPEGLAIASLWGRTFLFLGLERIGGIAVFDVTDPYHPEFVAYENPRDFAGDPEAGTAGDLGPEGLIVVHARLGEELEPVLVVGNEVSGTTTAFWIRKVVP